MRPHLQPVFPCLAAFFRVWQSVDFVNIQNGLQTQAFCGKLRARFPAGFDGVWVGSIAGGKQIIINGGDRMCGRYYIAEDDLSQELERIIAEINRKKTPEGLKTAGEIRPCDVAPVIANSRRQDVQPFAMRWGYSYPESRPVINARSETAAEKPLFRDGMQRRRCLIPASHYFEWEKRDGKRVKYAIRPAHADTLYLAGIYHFENHDGVTVPSFVILTREAAPDIAFIHNRMPVILSEERAADWLNPDNDAEEVIRAALQDMEYRPV